MAMIKEPFFKEDLDLSPVFQSDEVKKIYQDDVRDILSLPTSSTLRVDKKNVYEVEMYAALAYDCEQLEPIEKKQLQEAFYDLLKLSWHKADVIEARKRFLKDREEFIPSVVIYHNNKPQQFYFPRKSSLQTFYDTYLKDI